MGVILTDRGLRSTNIAAERLVVAVETSPIGSLHIGMNAGGAEVEVEAAARKWIVIGITNIHQLDQLMTTGTEIEGDIDSENHR